MFGWFRKRQRPATATVDAVAAQSAEHAQAALPQAPSTAAPALDFAAARDAASAREASAAAPAPSAAPGPSTEMLAQAGAPSSPAQAPHPAQAPQAEQSAAVAAAAAASPQARGPVSAPSLRPSMPLSDHPNFAGLGLAQSGHETPRLLDPEAALSDEARDELTTLLLDMFGPRGRYRLEWRADRQPGDDAMFSQIMVADLVRRIQNSIAVASDLELRAAPLPLAIEAVSSHPSLRDDETPEGPDAAANAASDVDAEAESAASLSETEREAAIEEFLSPAETLEQLAAATHPEPADVQQAPAAERRIA